MSLRRASATLIAVCVVALLVPMSALASTASRAHARAAVPATTLTDIPVTLTKGKKTYKGTFTVQRFVSKGGQSWAIGTLSTTIAKHTIHRNNVAVPVSVGSAPAGAHDAATCPILHLVLGPLNLNLLGLHVHLNQVVLDITAVSGPGQLLGNLLCSVANLLNGSGLPTGQVTGLLNILQSLLSSPGLLKL